MTDLIARSVAWVDRQGVWRGAAWGIGTMATIDGASFAAFGNAVAGGPSFYLLNQLPLGMRLPGVLMLAIGVWILATAHHRKRSAQLALMTMFIVGFTFEAFTVAGWVAAHAVGVSTFTKWFLLNWVAAWLSVTTDRPGLGRPDRDAA